MQNKTNNATKTKSKFDLKYITEMKFLSALKFRDGKRIPTPKYCQQFNDRHGKIRFYFRKAGLKRVALPGLPWTPKFMAAYENALEGVEHSVVTTNIREKSFEALIQSYYQSAKYKTLKDTTKLTYRRICENIRHEHGHKSVAGLKRKHLQELIDSKVDTPSAANNRKRCPGPTCSAPF